MASSLVFVGVDMSTLRQAERGKTIAAIGVGQEGGVHLASLELLTTDDAVASILRGEYACCGIDAPLSLPACALCRELPCECALERWMTSLKQPTGASYHYRLSDVLIRLTVPGVSPKPPLSNGGPVDITPLSLRWLRLARGLVGEGVSLKRVVEVYAAGAIQLYAQAAGLTELGQPFRYRGDEARRAALLSFLARAGRLTAPDVLWDQLVGSEDAFDAAFALLSAWHAHFRAVLTPDLLLGLEPQRSFGVTPLSEVSEAPTLAQREEMCRWLHATPWMMLPNVTNFAMTADREDQQQAT